MEEDLELLQKFRLGDEASFTKLVVKYQKPVLNIIYRFTQNKHMAEDMAQEVFIRVYRGAEKFEERSKFFTWLYRIAINYCIKQAQRWKSRQESSLEEQTEKGKLSDTISDPSPSPQGCLEKEYMMVTVRKAVLSLPDDQRAVVILSKFNQLSYEDIASVLKISVPSVKSKLHRAKLKLKEKLREVVL
ncbi:MAG: sigma-70 family RNA polymerase sigma factor [Firmicutes bacterium]|nr:sigma-70 family RNA polymerase sigma factor [Bacillota bacterium]